MQAINMDFVYSCYTNAGVPEERKAEAFAEDMAKPLPCFDTHKLFKALRMARGDIPKETVLDRFRHKQKMANLPKRFWNCTWGDLEKNGIPQEIQDNYNVIKKYAMSFKESLKTGSGLILCGNVGRMKTTLSAATCNQLLWNNFSVFFVPMAELLQMMVNYGKRQTNLSLENLERRVRDVDLLILDDVGTEYKSDWVINAFDAMISNRYNNLKPTLITTNLNMAEIEKLYKMRVFDRLRQTNVLLPFGGQSLRNTKREE